MRRGRQTGVWVLVATLALGACVDEPPAPEPAWCEVPVDDLLPGEVFDLQSYGVPLAELCGGSMAAAQRHAAWVAQRWGTPADVFDYLLYDTHDDGCWPCPEGFAGCVRQGNVHATILPHRHELAHAVRPSGCYLLIEEGWATLHGDPFLFAPPGESVPEILQILDAGERLGDHSNYGNYGTAARFVAFLLDGHGVDAVRALCETDIETSADFDAALLAVTGESLDALLAEFEGNPVFNATDLYAVNRLQQDLACEIGEQSVVTSPGSWTHDLRCSGAAVEGRRGRWLTSHQLVELPAPGKYTFTPTVDRDLRYYLELRSCDREQLASVYYINSPRTLYAGVPGNVEYPIEGELPAGTYVLRLWADDAKNDPTILDDSLTIDIAIAPAL